MGIYLRPIIRKTYISEGELDQVENTEILQNASPDQLLPQQMVVKD
jgi:hypothetical protein